VWRLLRRWGITTTDLARSVRWEIEHELDILENPAKRAMYRPISGIEHNQLWLVLNKPHARPARDPNHTDEDHQAAQGRFVANGARAVRDLVERLEGTFEDFKQPEDLKRTGAQRQFAKLYDALRSVTSTS
jgi:hypothetical protein